MTISRYLAPPWIQQLPIAEGTIAPVKLGDTFKYAGRKWKVHVESHRGEYVGAYPLTGRHEAKIFEIEKLEVV